MAVAWFSAADDTPVVRVRLSTDGGLTFNESIVVSAGRLAGYVGLTFFGNRDVAVSWVGRGASGTKALHLRTVSMAGELGEVRSIADIAQVRVFPQLGYQDGQLFLFWTDQADGVRELRGARVPAR